MVEVRVGELMQVFLNIFQNSQDAFIVRLPVAGKKC